MSDPECSCEQNAVKLSELEKRLTLYQAQIVREVELASKVLDERMKHSNNLIAMLQTWQGTTLPRAEYGLSHNALAAKLDVVEKAAANMEGRFVILALAFALIAAVAGAIAHWAMK